jgi:hypothetical protein
MMYNLANNSQIVFKESNNSDRVDQRSLALQQYIIVAHTTGSQRT